MEPAASVVASVASVAWAVAWAVASIAQVVTWAAASMQVAWPRPQE